MKISYSSRRILIYVARGGFIVLLVALKISQYVTRVEVHLENL